MKRIPDYQPFADEKPIILPRGGHWWQKLAQFVKSWIGALILLTIINASFIVYFSELLDDPKGMAHKIMETLAIKQINDQKNIGASEGEMMTKLNSDILSLKSENESLKIMIQKSSSLSTDKISISKLKIESNKVSWQLLIKNSSNLIEEFIIDARSYKYPIQIGDLITSNVVKVKPGGDLFDGVTQLYEGQYLVISIIDKNTKKIIESRIIKVK